MTLSKYLQASDHPTFDNFNADIRALSFDNRLAVSSERALSTFAAISTDSHNLKLYFKISGIDARVFSNTLDGDDNSIPSDTLATRGP